MLKLGNNTFNLGLSWLVEVKFWGVGFELIGGGWVLAVVVDSGRSPSATNLDPWKERLAGFPCRQLIHKQPAFLVFPFLSSYHHLTLHNQKKKVFFTFRSLFININNHSRLGSIYHQHSRFKSTNISLLTPPHPPNLNNTIITRNAFHPENLHRPGLRCLCLRSDRDC